MGPILLMMTSSNGNIFRVTGHLCGNSPVTGEFLAQRPVTQSFDVFFDLHLNKPLSKQSWGWWFETLSRPLWRHCNVIKGPFHLKNFHHQIRWKFRFTLISIPIEWSLENVVHDTRVELSCHVQTFLAIWWPATELQYSKAKFPSNLNYGKRKYKKRQWNGLQVKIGTWTSYNILVKSGM